MMNTKKIAVSVTLNSALGAIIIESVHLALAGLIGLREPSGIGLYQVQSFVWMGQTTQQ